MSWFRLSRWFYFHQMRSSIVHEYRRFWNQRFGFSSALGKKRKWHRHVLLSTWCYARCLVDSGSATLNKLYWRSDVDLLDQIEEMVVNRSPTAKTTIWYQSWEWCNWKIFIAPVFRPIRFKVCTYFRLYIPFLYLHKTVEFVIIKIQVKYTILKYKLSDTYMCRIRQKGNFWVSNVKARKTRVNVVKHFTLKLTC